MGFVENECCKIRSEDSVRAFVYLVVRAINKNTIVLKPLLFTYVKKVNLCVRIVVLTRRFSIV